MSKPSVHTASVSWHNDTPYSDGFDDIYFNPDQGIDESDYVFLQGNRVSEQFGSTDHPIFTIAETGFGTGLNFLCTAQAFLKHAPDAKCLHFISVEKHPLSAADLETALSNWPQFSKLSTSLLRHYPPCVSGVYRLSFAGGRISLTLIIGDAVEGFSNLSADIDAWYLDGFAPSKNPEMWTPELFQQTARLSHPGTTFATFTAAGLVRRGLVEAGFKVEKRKGFGHKREMLIGEYQADSSKISAPPWFAVPKIQRPKQVTIIGGGLAGSSTARALAERDIRVRVLDKAPSPANGGSGNPQGALYAKLPVKPTKQGEFHLSGLLYSLNLLQHMDPEQNIWSQCGVAQLATNRKEQQRQAELIEAGYYPDAVIQSMSAAELSHTVGSKVTCPGLFMPRAGWVAPRLFCETLLDHPLIEWVGDCQITELTYQEKQWQLLDTMGNTYSSEVAILCGAEESRTFSVTEHLPLKPIRGQVSMVETSPTMPPLKTVVCGDGYISPAHHHQFCFGATFDLRHPDLNITQEDHQKNLVKLADILPELHKEIEESKQSLTGRTSLRCSTPDYLPIVGPAPDQTDFVQRFAALRRDRKWHFQDTEAVFHPGLYINCGHGSKGLITCPLSAEVLACMICNEPLPVGNTVTGALSPARFIIKDLIRNRI